MFGEIVQYRPQRQARPVRGRTFRVDRAAGRNHVVGIRLGRIHEICGASFQQNATGGALEPCGDDDVRLGLFDGFQQRGPGFGEAHRKRDVGDGDGDVLQQFFGDRLRLRRIGPLLGYRRRHEHGRIDVDAFIGRETGDDDVDLLHGFQCTW